MTTFKVKEVSKYIANVLRRDSFYPILVLKAKYLILKNREDIVILV